jgi:hypothetical protein
VNEECTGAETGHSRLVKEKRPMSVELNLPTFGLDCREWLVATEADGLVLDDNDGAPVVAVLSTAVVVGAQLRSARAVLSLALLNDDSAESNGAGRDATHGPDAEPHVAPGTAARPASGAVEERASWVGQDICVLDADWDGGYARFAVPVPGGDLAVVAEFRSAPAPTRELIDRFYDLVTSFRWAA